MASMSMLKETDFSAALNGSMSEPLSTTGRNGAAINVARAYVGCGNACTLGSAHAVALEYFQKVRARRNEAQLMLPFLLIPFLYCSPCVLYISAGEHVVLRTSWIYKSRLLHRTCACITFTFMKPDSPS